MSPLPEGLDPLVTVLDISVVVLTLLGLIRAASHFNNIRTIKFTLN